MDLGEHTIREAAALIYEYKHGEPPGDRPLGPGWDCWKVAESVLLQPTQGAVEALDALMTALDFVEVTGEGPRVIEYDEARAAALDHLGGR